MPDLFNTKIRVKNKYDIYCKVTNPNKHQIIGKEGRFVLLLQGGPGLGMAGIESYQTEIDTLCTKQGGSSFHFILIDPIGCGKSDKTQDKTEYSIEAQAETIAQVIENIAAQLNIKMDLQIIARSAGAMIALTLATLRPHWITHPSSIHLRQVIAISMPVNYATVQASIECVEKNNELPPSLKQAITDTMKREAKGEITVGDNNRDFVNMIILFSVLWSNKGAESASSLPFSCFKALFQHAYRPSMGLLRTVASFSPDVNRTYRVLRNSSVEALNHYYHHKFYGFDAAQLFHRYPEIFNQLMLCFIGGQEDHVANPIKNGTLDLLRSNSQSQILFKNARHVIETDHREKLFEFLHHLLKGQFSKAYLDTLTTETSLEFYFKPEFYAHQQELAKINAQFNSIEKIKPLFSKMGR